MFEIFLKIIVAFNIYKLKNGQGVHHASIKDNQRIKVVPQSRMSLFPILIQNSHRVSYAICHVHPYWNLHALNSTFWIRLDMFWYIWQHWAEEDWDAGHLGNHGTSRFTAHGCWQHQLWKLRVLEQAGEGCRCFWGSPQHLNDVPSGVSLSWAFVHCFHPGSFVH